MLTGKVRGLPWGYLAGGVAKAIFSALVMGGWLFWLVGCLADWLTGGFVGQLLAVLAAVVSGAVVYGRCLYACRVKELEMIVGKVAARWRE